MRGPGSPRRAGARWLAAVWVALAVTGVVTSACAAARSGAQGLAVDGAQAARAIPGGFVGLSIEDRGLEEYAGQDPKAVSPPFLQLIRSLAPGQRPVIRIGGDGTDWTWFPVAGLRRPPGVRYDLSPQWTKVAAAVAGELNARLILGVNLEADDRRVAAGEARALIAGVGSHAIEALELGNEPELYGAFGWYQGARGPVLGRPRGYGFTSFLGEFSSFAPALPRVALAGPSSGAPKFISRLGAFLGREPKVRVATLHAYPLKRCSASTHVTAAQLLADSSSAGLADSLARYVAIAHHHRIPLRIDEMNGISCGGQRGVSDTFASALWSLDALFEMARVGIDGVNVHTVPGAINEIIGSQQVHGQWQDTVHPEYYGMMMFAQATPAGAQLLRLPWRSSGALKAWATRAPDGHIRVVLINRGSRARTVHVSSRSARPAALERLLAPSLSSTAGVTLGGQTFGPVTSTGLLGGTPSAIVVKPASGGYTITLPGTSAAMLTI